MADCVSLNYLSTVALPGSHTQPSLQQMRSTASSAMFFLQVSQPEELLAWQGLLPSRTCLHCMCRNACDALIALLHGWSMLVSITHGEKIQQQTQQCRQAGGFDVVTASLQMQQ
jgi:hypothetical protein